MKAPHDLLLINMKKKQVYDKSIGLKPGPAWRVNPDLADSGLELARIEEKIEEGKTRRDPANPAGWPGKTRSKIRLRPVDFFFFWLKQRYFDFKRKRILTRATRWAGQNPGSESWIVAAIKPGLKTMDKNIFRSLKLSYSFDLFFQENFKDTHLV